MPLTNISLTLCQGILYLWCGTPSRLYKYVSLSQSPFLDFQESQVPPNKRLGPSWVFARNEHSLHMHMAFSVPKNKSELSRASYKQVIPEILLLSILVRLSMPKIVTQSRAVAL